MLLETIVVADRVKVLWVKPVVRSVSAGSAEAAGVNIPDGLGTHTS